MHVADPYELEAETFRSDNAVTSRPEDSDLPDLGQSFQFLEPMALAEVAEQVYETVLREEVRHLLALRAPPLVKFHVKLPKDDCVIETFQSLLQVRKVL